MEVRLGDGFGPVRFGMSELEADAALNEPEQYEDWMGGNLDHHLLYSGLVLEFKPLASVGPDRDPDLVEIKIHGRDGARLFDKPVDQWTEDDLLTELVGRGYRAERMSNGDVIVPWLAEFSFDREGRLTCLGLSRGACPWPRRR